MMHLKGLNGGSEGGLDGDLLVNGREGEVHVKDMV